MPHRPNPFLERRLRRPPGPPPPAAARTSWFQRARDWTAFVVSLTSLVTSVIALRNTLTGPRPFLAGLEGEAVTILRSTEFRLGSPPAAALALRDESGQPAEFPLIIVQPALGNRAQPPNGIGVRGIEAELVLRDGARPLLRSEYVWYRTTESTSQPSPAGGGADLIVFGTAVQAGPFDLPGGTTWSREVLLIPRETRAEVGWTALARGLEETCARDPARCGGEVTLRVRLDSGAVLATRCAFGIDGHVLAHVRGEYRRFFTSPPCRATSPPSSARPVGIMGQVRAAGAAAWAGMTAPAR